MNEDHVYKRKRIDNGIYFTADYTSSLGKVFKFNTSWEYFDSYKGISEDLCAGCTPDIIMWYRIKDGGNFHHIPETVITPIQYVPNQSNKDNDSTTHSWDKRVTQDEYTRLTGTGDYVRAAREIQNRNISAKERQQQTDFRDEAYWNQIEYNN